MAPLFEQLQGKELSYNNLIDVDAAWSLAQDLPDTGVCIVKHTNPCGAAAVAGSDQAEAFRRALACDPVSAFGSIIGCNRLVTADLAREITQLFVEVVVAPDFDAEALELFAKKKKLRLVRAPRPAGQQRLLRSALGGLLVQERDALLEDVLAANVATKRQPSAAELAEMQFAWAICKHVKSNAIVFTRDRQLVGVGAGQMSRVDAVKIAERRAVLPIDGGVAASDAFFPFATVSINAPTQGSERSFNRVDPCATRKSSPLPTNVGSQWCSPEIDISGTRRLVRLPGNGQIRLAVVHARAFAGFAGGDAD